MWFNLEVKITNKFFGFNDFYEVKCRFMHFIHLEYCWYRMYPVFSLLFHNDCMMSLLTSLPLFLSSIF